MKNYDFSTGWVHGALKGAEPAVPALGPPAKKLRQADQDGCSSLLGDHQDSVVARERPARAGAPRRTQAGESGFTCGLLYGREEALAAWTGNAKLPRPCGRRPRRRKHRRCVPALRALCERGGPPSGYA